MSATTQLLAWLEPRIFGLRARRRWLLALAALTLGLLVQALRVGPDAGLDKTLPLGHPYMQVFRQYQEQFGGANIVLVALQQQDGTTIFNARFLAALKRATEEVNFIPGIDRARMSSIFTRNVRFIEVVDGGFAAGDVIPADYAPSDATFARIRENVGKAGLNGRLVTAKQDGAMVYAEVLDRDPATGIHSNLVDVAKSLENLRGRFESPQKVLYRARGDLPPFKAGEVVLESFQPLGWRTPITHFRISKSLTDGSRSEQRVWGWQLDAEQMANPEYDPNLRVYILGFAKLVGDVSAAMLQVAAFFALTVLGTGLALAWYLGSLRLALLPLTCSLVAVIWEFGLLKTVGMGLDPFAILVPFLVLAVSTSHGVQYVNTWADEVVRGSNGFDASRATFRRLFVPGAIALITNVAGFATIYFVPIEAVREMAINACLGMLAVIVTNKLLMPLWLSHLAVRDVDEFRARRLKRLNAGDVIWQRLSAVTETKPALALLAIALVVLVGSLALQPLRIIGDAQAGVPELRPDSRYNQDVAAVSHHYSLGTDVLKIIAEAPPDSCVDYSALTQIDDYTWRIANTPGVIATQSMPQLARKVYAGLWENSPRFLVLPRNRDSLVLTTKSIESGTGLLNFECTALPISVYAADHRAATIARILQSADQYERQNRSEFYQDHPQSNPAECDARSVQLRELGAARVRRQQSVDALLAQGLLESATRSHPRVTAIDEEISRLAPKPVDPAAPCPVHFALATGNLGVMAATNDAVHAAELPALLWVYAVILLLIAICYRSWRGWVVIGVPLFLVSIFANALMAVFGIGLKVATLPVVTLAVGIGVDYGIYIYDVLQHQLADGKRTLREAYFETLRQTGKAVIFTGICLAGGVSAWLFSGLQFQRDMGLLLVFMFSANMLGAVLIGPALCRFVLKRR